MKVSKNKLIAAVAVVLVLIAAYFSSGPPDKKVDAPTRTASPSATSAPEKSPNGPQSTQLAQVVQPSSASQPEPTTAPVTPQPTPSASVQPPATPPPAVTEQLVPTSPTTLAGEPKAETDKYLTEPVPSGKPLPVEPQDVKITDKAFTAYLSVTCETILNNLNKLDREKLELVPKDGVIFAKREVTFYEGESVFNVLQREMKKNKIHMEFENTPIYNSAYIEGIHNLYEFDCGELSGWMYKVNDWFPNYGSSRYKLKQGDVIEWVYTCDLGRDVGDTYKAAGSAAR
ncbi:DUF4430 domain-containing protein [Paenibacillus koleovorans]|uniref:DUF4430 domain-containing protein n=1 Tax=Paenibacillus koleovorans TaxID=121608 RepID=UPI000FD954CA|nr:DUF4430 domain-containing protein [Paenibacillus koleovorans]